MHMNILFQEQLLPLTCLQSCPTNIERAADGGVWPYLKYLAHLSNSLYAVMLRNKLPFLNTSRCLCLQYGASFCLWYTPLWFPRFSDLLSRLSDLVLGDCSWPAMLWVLCRQRWWNAVKRSVVCQDPVTLLRHFLVMILCIPTQKAIFSCFSLLSWPRLVKSSLKVGNLVNVLAVYFSMQSPTFCGVHDVHHTGKYRLYFLCWTCGCLCQHSCVV